MARVIPAEFQSILKASLGDTADLVRVTGTIPTPEGPRVLFDVVGSPDPCFHEAHHRGSARRRRGGEPIPGGPVAIRTASHGGAAPALGNPIEASPRIYDEIPSTSEGWHWLLCMIAEWLSEGGLAA